MAEPTVRATRTRRWLSSPWVEAAAIAGVGLYMARVSAEYLPGARTAPQLVFLVIVGLVTGWFVAQLLDRWQIAHAELSLLLIYVFWPTFRLPVAWAVGLLTLGLWLWRMRHLASPYLQASVPWLPEALAGVLGLVLYASTVAPGLLPADAGEFQLVGATLGIAHPPGYPLYTLLAKLATLLPVGDPAYRVNLLSVVFASVTLILLARLVRRISPLADGFRGVAWSAVLAAAGLACSPTFWVQATTANVRSLTALFTAALLLYAVRYVQEPRPWRLVRLAFVFGLAMGHHSSLTLLGLPLALYIGLSDRDLLKHPARLVPALGAWLASLLVLAYLPLRSAMHPAFDPVPVDSLARFLDHVLSLGFRGDMLYISSAAGLIERFGVYVQIVRLQFGSWLPWAMLLGLGGLFWRDWRLGLLIGGVWLVNALSAITYRAPQTVEYLLPSYVAMAAALGCGLRLIAERLFRRPSTGLLLSAVSVLLVSQVMITWPDMQSQHEDDSTYVAAARLLRQAPEGAVILSNWHWATPLWYLQMVEGQRPDVEVVYVYPEGDVDNGQTWLRRIQQEIISRPVVVTNRYYAFDAAALILEPLSGGWLVRLLPSDSPPAAATRVALTLGERIRIEAISAPERGTPGETLHVDLYWRPTVRLDRDYAVSVQLLGPEGVVGQADRQQPTSTYPPNRLRSDSLEVPLLLQTLPGRYELIVGFYTVTPEGWERLTTDAGADYVTLGYVEVDAGSQLAATRRPIERIFEGGYQLAGMDVDRSVEGTTRLYLHWSRAEVTPGRALRISLRGEDTAELATATLPALSNGETAVTVLDLPGSPPRVHLTLLDDGGTARRPLTVCRLPGAEALRLDIPVGPQHYVPLGGEVVYLGLAQRQARATAGEPFAVRPRLLSLRRLDRDLSLSVGLAASDGSWRAKADDTPALGAIPTLKWLTGWQVTSLLQPTVPAEAGAGTAQVTLEGYDAFTLTPLAVLDERLVRQGQGTYLVVDTVEVVPAR